MERPLITQPLFWLDMGAYQGAQLKAITVADELRGFLVDASSSADDALINRLSDSFGFRAVADETPHKLFAPARDYGFEASFRTAFPEATEIPFNAQEHLLIAQTMDALDTASAPDLMDTASSSLAEPSADVSADPALDVASLTAADDVDAVPTSDHQDASGKRDLIVDTGEVRGIPIKWLRGNGDAVLDAVRRMTAEEIKGKLTKKAIWPSLNYVKMADAGVEPGAACLIKSMRDSLCRSPGYYSTRRYYVGTDPEIYAHTVAFIRDAMANVKTLDEAVDAAYRVSSYYCDLDIIDVDAKSPRMRYSYAESPMTPNPARDPILSNTLSGIVSERGAIWTREPASTDPAQKPYVSDRYFSYMRRFALIRTMNNEAWGFLPRTHPLRTGLSGKLTDEEKQNRQDRLDRMPPTRVRRPLFADAVRTGGREWHTGNVTSEQLIQEFDLSGVEFGNQESQRERQELMNQTYDAFHDMADVLGISPLAVGFGGKLGLAFGSRGRGGKNAACAHFEPTNFAINLTKKGGAGSLLHEWMHAFDRSASHRGVYADRHAGMATDDLDGRWTHQNAPKDISSSLPMRYISLSKDTASALDNVMLAIRTDPHKTLDKAVNRYFYNSANRVADLIADAEGDAHPANPSAYLRRQLGSHDLREIFDAVTRASREAWAPDTGVDTLLMDRHSAVSLHDEIASIAFANLGTRRGDTIDNMCAAAAKVIETYSASHADVWTHQRQQLALGRTKELVSELQLCYAAVATAALIYQGDHALDGLDDIGIDADCRDTAISTLADATAILARYVPYVPSTMQEMADRMDWGRKPYWGMRREMFARAMESYAKSKLADCGIRNDFLVAFSKPSNKNGEVYESVYPTGDHLARIATAADRMFSGLQQEEIESKSPLRQGQSGVLLYSLDGDTITAGVPGPIRAEMVCDEITRMLGKAVHIRLTDTLGALDGHTVAGSYMEFSNLILVAMKGADPLSAARHESYHAAVHHHIVTPDEHAMVVNAFQPGGRHHSALIAALRDDGKEALIPEVLAHPDEAAAYGFQYWSAGRLTARSDNPVQRAFSRIRDFFESVTNVVRGYGYHTADEIMADLYDGALIDRVAQDFPDHSTDVAAGRGPKPQSVRSAVIGL